MLDIDYIDWDDADDMGGKVQYIAAADLTVDEVEEVLYDSGHDVGVSRSTGRPAVSPRGRTARVTGPERSRSWRPSEAAKRWPR
ncbi:hypothetical protein V5E97_04400 [Singulisphaera sp. Ch08]|uniref:Uncharacterized protein n=1 Tax=Singulisphaera sp. Ch08 TaxID=3120278 RepID=A0AAU7CK07_9BACT